MIVIFMTISKPKYRIKEQCWEMYWSPLPIDAESSTGNYPERVVFPEYCNALWFYNAMKEASKIKTDDRQDKEHDN